MGLINTAPRGLKPWRHVWGPWRGGQIFAIGATATLKVLAEENIIRDYVVSLGLLPAGAIVGDPIVVRVSGGFPYTIAEVRPSRFAGSGPGSNQQAAVAAGRFDAGVITSNEDPSLSNPFYPA